MEKILLTWWFDTEDFVTPRSDDPPKWIAEFFREHEYKATFKMVAEKVRSLRKRQRLDVIQAIAAHEVGYHTNNHSVHPTVYEYLRKKTWEDGCREFERREGEGFKLIKENFRNVVCFGHPGTAWAAEAYPSLSKWKIPVYLDSSSILTLNDEPYWYCNVLNLQVGETNFIRVDPELKDAKSFRALIRRYDKICNRLRKNGPGIASMLLHPHTLVTLKYADSLNFANGRNRHKNGYVLPPLRTPVEVGLRLQRFQEFVKYTASRPNTRMITATDAAKIYRDRAKEHVYKRRHLLQLVSQITDRITYVECDGFFLSPSEILWLTVSALADYSRRHRVSNNLRILPILGPSKRVRTHGSREVNVARLLRSSVLVQERIRRERRVPNMVKVGNTILSPADYLAVSARALRMILTERILPPSLYVQTVKFDCEKHIDVNSFNRAFKWYILPKGFKSPNLIEHAKLQTWTLKPAVVGSA